MAGYTNANQKLQSLYTKLGITSGSYEAAFHKYWDSLGTITGTTFNERMLKWINVALSTSYASLPQAMQAYAVAKGAYNWDSLGDLGLP